MKIKDNKIDKFKHSMHKNIKIVPFVIAFLFSAVVGYLLGILLVTTNVFLQFNFLKSLWDFLDSNFFQSLIIIFTALVAIYGGLNMYFVQQRITQLRKIYFNETLLITRKNIEVGLEKTNNMLLSSEKIFDLIMNSISQTYVDKDIFLKKLVDIRSQMFVPIHHSDAHYNRFEEIIGWKKASRLLQWIEKAQKDFISFTRLLEMQIDALINNLQMNDVRRKEKDKEILKDISTHLQNQYRLVQRHYALLKLFDKLASVFSTCKYKSIEEIKSFSDRREITDILKKIDETFSIIFAFYKPKNVEDDWLFSYAIDEYGKRFKIVKTKDKLRITREVVSDDDLGELVVYQDESNFADSIIEDTKNNYITALIGLGNMMLFKEKPDFIKESKEF